MQAPGSCNGVVRRVLFLQRAAAACALADGPGAPSVEGKQYCVHFVLDLEQGGHTLLRI